MQKYQLGALKDPVDQRDYLVRGFLTIKTVDLPTKHDVSGTMSPIRNQGSEGSCVSFASTAAKEYDELMTDSYLSPRFIADRIQKDADSGAYPRDAMDVLLREGVCTEECQPYVAREIINPCLNSEKLAAENKIKAYARLYTLDEMKRYLYERGAFMASFRVTDEWFHPVQGLVTPTGPVIGGHAVCIVGYDNEKSLMKFRNSWGPTWGDAGYGYLPYITVTQYLMDAWSMVDVPDAEEEKPVPPKPEPPSPKPEPTPAPKNWVQILIEWIINYFDLNKRNKISNVPWTDEDITR